MILAMMTSFGGVNQNSDGDTTSFLIWATKESQISVDGEPSESLVLKYKVYTYWSEKKKYFHIQIPRKITENQSPQKSLNKKPQGAGRKMDEKIKDCIIEKTLFLQSKVAVGMPLPSVRMSLYS